MDIAGHVSPRMLRRYSHIQLEAKRTAIESLSNRRKTTASEDGDVTKHETVAAIPQVIEKNGWPVRARTADLHRVNNEVSKLNPFACLAFPFLTSAKRA
jgi:hypothetical protein